MGLVGLQPLLRTQPVGFGLGFHSVDLREAFHHSAALFGKGALDVHKVAARMHVATAIHGRMPFGDIQSAFPEECRRVVESFSEIYRVEAQAKADGLGPQERLEAHQAHSQPVMDQLKAWFDEQIDGRKVEPNSGLAQAIGYMRERWTELTQFLRVPGAPLDNNVTERILKMSILHRKNSLFYRT